MIPFFWMISTSLKTKGAVTALPIEWIPKEPTTEAYSQVFSMFPFVKAIFNSLFITVSYTVITVISSSMAAFAFTKIDFKFSNKLFKVYLASTMIPIQVTLIPLFVVMNKLHLINTYPSVILPSLFKAFAVFLMVSNMRSLPNDFVEAAKIDGASLFKIYKNIVLPMCAPGIATLCITTFMESWNDYLWPLLMLTDKNKMTLTLALNSLNGQYHTAYNMLMAGSLMSIIPIIIVYVVAQIKSKKSTIEGGVKG
jgi:multiple sugar transport system permease protein